MLKTNVQSNRETNSSQAADRADALLNAWAQTLAENRERPAIFDVNGAITRTFSGIEDRAKAFQHSLDAFHAGEVVAIQIGNHPDWPSIFLACLRRRLVVLPLERSMAERERTAAMKVCGASAVFAFVRGCAGDEAVLLRTKSHQPPNWRRNQPSVLKLTSGTTAAPRAIRFRSEQLLADCENICDTMEITRRDRNFGVIPISHSYGFSNLLTPLLARAVPMTLTSDRMPRAILDGVAISRATIFPGMPVFYESFCELSDPPPLPALRLCISAGAPLSSDLAERFRAKFGHVVHSFYGSSECGGICYVREPQSLPGFVGPPILGVEIEEMDLAGEAFTIRVRSRAVADGYFPDPDETRLGSGGFLPDDLLEKTAGGYRVVGRVSDLINVAGKKVNPAEIEAAILECEGVREAIAFGRESARRNQEVAACVVAVKKLCESDVLTHCREHLSGWQVPRRVYFVDTIPINERGKTSRRDLARLYPRGS